MTDSADTIHVLHVDDDPEFVDLTAPLLEQERREDTRIRVHTATSAPEGLEVLAENSLDCIISDYDMPVMNGIEFLEAVREDYPDIPFILFTGKGSEEIASEAISAGVSDYLQKEVGPDQYVVLANRIENLVSRQRARADLEARTEQQQKAAQRREYHRDVLLELATDDAVANGEFETASRRISETAAEVLDVPRVNIWLADDEAGGRRFTCVDHFDRRTGEHLSAMELEVDEYPAYLEALETHRSIDAVDARHDPRTAELTDDYLDPHDIGALLDATLRLEGRTMGVVCHEHVGGVRVWTDEEIDFASDVADIVHRALRNQERREREQVLRETSQQLQAVLDTVEAPIFIKDTEGRYQLMNQACRDLLGLDSDVTITGRTDFDFFSEEMATKYQAGDRRVLERQETIEIEEEVPTEEGTHTYLTLKSPFFDEDGELQGICAVSTDITDRQAYRREIQHQNERLDEFASVVSHDLRNPLSVAESHLLLARKSCDCEHLDQIGNALDRMERIIGDMLWLAREGKDLISTESVDLGEAVEEGWTMVSGDNTGSELIIDEQGLDPIEADPDRLSQLLENLFGNALTHGGETVTITVGPLDGGFFVEDDGRGIPPEHRDDVFEAGYSTNNRGTGFGLSIVERIVDAHHWDIDLTESSDGGARFEITGVEDSSRRN